MAFQHATTLGRPWFLRCDTWMCNFCTIHSMGNLGLINDPRCGKLNHSKWPNPHRFERLSFHGCLCCCLLSILLFRTNSSSFPCHHTSLSANINHLFSAIRSQHYQTHESSPDHQSLPSDELLEKVYHQWLEINIVEILAIFKIKTARKLSISFLSWGPLF